MTEPTANRQIARAAGTVMVAFIISNLAGLVRQILVANAFGTQADMDAFNAANRVSETLFNLVAGGALSSAFIPAFTGLLARGDRERAWGLASAIGNLILLLLTGLSILAALLAPQIVRYLLAPGFAADPAQAALTVKLLRLMLPSAAIFGLSGLVMSILNSNRVFLLPALAPAMYQLGLIIGVTLLRPYGIFGLAYGVVLGALLHLALQLPALFKLQGRYWPRLDLGMADVREVLWLMGPRLLGVAVVQLNFWINTRLASQYVEGSVTGVVLAFSLMLMPQAAIAQSIAIAAMPMFSAQAALGKLDEMRRSLAASLRGAMMLSIPAAVGLMVLREPLVALLYQRGQFDQRSTQLVAWALLWYAAGLVGHALVEILSRAFYALHDTATPVMVGIGAMSLNILFSFIFAGLFLRLGWMPHGGLALANSVATALEAGVLLLIMRRRLGGLGGRVALDGGVRSLLAALAMLAALSAWLWLAHAAPAWQLAAVGVPLGALVYILAAWLFGVEEVPLVWAALARRAALLRRAQR